MRSGATRMTGATEASNAARLAAVKRNVPRGATYQELALSRPNKPPQGRMRFHWSVGPRRPTTTTVADRKAWKIANRLPPSLLGPFRGPHGSMGLYHPCDPIVTATATAATSITATDAAATPPYLMPLLSVPSSLASSLTPRNLAFANIVTLASSAADEPRWARTAARCRWQYSLYGR